MYTVNKEINTDGRVMFHLLLDNEYLYILEMGDIEDLRQSALYNLEMQVIEQSKVITDPRHYRIKVSNEIIPINIIDIEE